MSLCFDHQADAIFIAIGRLKLQVNVYKIVEYYRYKDELEDQGRRLQKCFLGVVVGHPYLRVINQSAYVPQEKE